MRKNRLGTLRLENIISAVTGAQEGEPVAIIEHKIDTPTLIALGVITGGAILLNYFLTLNK